MGLDPAFVDFDCECPDQTQSAFLVGEDANNMGAAFKFLINAFEHISALEMLVVLPGQPVKSESLLDILFNPRAPARWLRQENFSATASKSTEDSSLSRQS